MGTPGRDITLNEQILLVASINSFSFRIVGVSFATDRLQICFSIDHGLSESHCAPVVSHFHFTKFEVARVRVVVQLTGTIQAY